MNSWRLAVLIALGAVLSAMTGVVLAGTAREVRLADSTEMAKEIRQASEAIRKDPSLSEYSATVLYWDMTQERWPERALDVFVKAKAAPILRQALLTNNLLVIQGAAEYFERTEDTSGLPELVNALERKNFLWGFSDEAMAHGLMQQTLARAIAAVTGETAVLKPYLPKGRFRQMQPAAVHQFLDEIRGWAKVNKIELYPPAETQPWPQTEPPPPPTLDDQLDSVIMSLYHKEPSIRKEALERLRSIRDRIDDVLKEEAAVPEKAAPGTE